MILHHVGLPTRSLDHSIIFYGNTIGLEQIHRPPFKTIGAWFAVGTSQLHIILTPDGTFRPRPTIDTGDVHFAIRVENFEAAVTRLVARGYRENAPDGDTMRLVVIRSGPAGFPQAFLLDPDWHIIEINAAE